MLTNKQVVRFAPAFNYFSAICYKVLATHYLHFKTGRIQKKQSQNVFKYRFKTFPNNNNWIFSDYHTFKQARIQRGSLCSYNTAMECKIMTEMSLWRQSNLHRMTVFMSRSALVQAHNLYRSRLRFIISGVTHNHNLPLNQKKLWLSAKIQVEFKPTSVSDPQVYLRNLT